MLHRPLGTCGLSVSVLSLGSWRTYERIPREQGVAVLQAAREAGIDFLEIARYDDETGTAPSRTGYSEVVFGEIFAASGWPRDEVTIAEKLWWELWPEQDAAAELDASLERTGLDRVDLLYADPPPPKLPLEEVVAQIGALLAAGRVQAWGIVNWQPEPIARVGEIAAAQGVPAPAMAQLPVSLVERDWVHRAAPALEAHGISLIASYTLAGGILTGKHAAGAEGRMRGALDDPRSRAAVAAVRELAPLAAELDTTPAALALAFPLADPRTAAVLFGATRPEQVTENAAAVEVLERLDAAQLARLRAIGR